ncbi:L-dopachrome tautomerase-like isoform X1 [Rhincodon typus]|uniref:L-dopachrome tautomerase-like isoform X1 n=1 Tax=Rhincodon typus TaxID=259920 RepID=UPI00202DE9F3|nr:L-dopachrome tautomerase-like isoform X1 [Rhincodon typus]
MTLINISRKTTPERTSTSEEQCIMETTSNFCDEDGSQPTGFDLVCPPVHGGPVFRFNHYDQRFTEMPTWADVHGCLQIQMFDTHPYDTTATHSFRNALEGNINPQDPSQGITTMHNLVHRFCGGTLEFSNKAANDPLFPSLHVTVDK